MKDHWNHIYKNTPLERLGWYESNLNPTVRLIEQTQLSKGARILNVGAGTTTLIDELIKMGYYNLLATDISDVALNMLNARLGKNSIEIIVDDITNPSKLNRIKPIDLWIDRAVLHFFTRKKGRKTYFSLVNKLLKPGGHILFAQFNIKSAKKCSGLPVYRYNKAMLHENLSNEFKLIDSFDYNFVMPSGDLRTYVYALFKRQL